MKARTHPVPFIICAVLFFLGLLNGRPDADTLEGIGHNVIALIYFIGCVIVLLMQIIAIISEQPADDKADPLKGETQH